MIISASGTLFLNVNSPFYVVFFVLGCYASNEAIDFGILIQKLISYRSDF